MLFLFTCGLWTIIFHPQRVTPISSLFFVLCSNLISFSLTCIPPRSPLTFSFSCKQWRTTQEYFYARCLYFIVPQLCFVHLCSLFVPPALHLRYSLRPGIKKNEREKRQARGYRWGSNGMGEVERK
ncbi:MAG: hypothetical protein JOS17DRAFT_373304 [Linnemannia elongata]|nr:MAG: hypothetical protein JOS17DRAFT_373304 [Linnemannia elongata]